jgi:hypothetical protein
LAQTLEADNSKLQKTGHFYFALTDGYEATDTKISIPVLNSSGKLMMECVVETNASASFSADYA